ncbi:AT-hook motif nuclear-localized protein 28-like [Andrographis paniculata]|uniref:AT-hook motif nuclear-localized protein 28-like n=1 Tax=Andrographis paniculata TaxID=175694 RepID=UPI0021E80594|nr:AT-hook motif nuclear-localized protein 28-like [Andrographis paniculata]
MFPKFPHHPSPPLSHRGAAPETDTKSHSPLGGGSGIPLPPPPVPNDGASIEVIRRPRGRPPGSKNKPKSQVVVAREPSEPTMSPYVLELPAGADIVEATARFSRKRGIGLCILSGNGIVTDVTLKQPSAAPGAVVSCRGRFDILSISGTILPAGAGGGDAAAGNGMFTLSLAGPHGQVVGGLVVAPLVAAGTIYLVAATFNNPTFHRLQQTEEEQDLAAAGGNGRHESAVAGGGGGGGVSMYNYQPAGDVVWPPAGRQPY